MVVGYVLLVFVVWFFVFVYLGGVVVCVLDFVVVELVGVGFDVVDVFFGVGED